MSKKEKKRFIFPIVAIGLFLSACLSSNKANDEITNQATPAVDILTATPEGQIPATITPEPTIDPSTPTPDLRFLRKNGRVGQSHPELTNRSRDIYVVGQENGVSLMPFQKSVIAKM